MSIPGVCQLCMLQCRSHMSEPALGASPCPSSSPRRTPTHLFSASLPVLSIHRQVGPIRFKKHHHMASSWNALVSILTWASIFLLPYKEQTEEQIKACLGQRAAADDIEILPEAGDSFFMSPSFTGGSRPPTTNPPSSDSRTFSN